MGKQLKNIGRMFAFIEGNIADKSFLADYGIDTIVNAANPTLRKSEKNYEEPGVNLSIHLSIDKLAREQGYFEKKVIEEWEAKKAENKTYCRGGEACCCKKKEGRRAEETLLAKTEIRCPRGQAVLTKGYGLCERIIHVVGAEYDGNPKKCLKSCSSSKIETLDSCYHEIVNLLKQHTEIKSLAIPIIGAGNYGFPFELAARIALASMVNAFIDWRIQDPEMFEIINIPKIYFVIYDTEEQVQKEHFACINKIWQEKYKLLAQENQRIVYQKSLESHCSYLKEILAYDGTRGYFSFARSVRLALMCVRLIIFWPVMCLKDILGKSNWKKRRQSVERLAIAKIFLPLFLWLLISRCPTGKAQWILEIGSAGLTIYCICDTITYLLILMITADIQRPSANLIRSMLLLFVNYIEVALDLAFLYWLYYQNCIHFHEALSFGILGNCQITEPTKPLDYIWPYLNAGMQFFFLTLVFGYLANHMHQKKFLS